MKLKIKVTLIYPNDPPSENRPYGTRNEMDSYEQQIEIDESIIPERLQAVIRAFNSFK